MNRRTEFLGWSALHPDNGLISPVLVPDIGGRVLQFWLGDHPFLFVGPQPVEVVRRGEALDVRGAFGVFVSGRAQLRLAGSARVLLDRPADPREPLILADDVPSPLEARLELKLVLVDASGGVLGTIGQAEVTT